MADTEENIVRFEQFRDKREAEQFPLVPDLQAEVERVYGPEDHPWEAYASQQRFMEKLLDEIPLNNDEPQKR